MHNVALGADELKQIRGPGTRGALNIKISVAVRYKKSISIIETVISIDYRYIDFLASYFSDRSRGIDRVGDNWRTVNTSANPHISDQLTELRTEYTW